MIILTNKAASAALFDLNEEITLDRMSNYVKMSFIKHYQIMAMKVSVEVYFLSERGSHRLKASFSSDIV